MAVLPEGYYMADGLLLSKYSIGVGDRFAHQGKAQLRACMMAAEKGVEVIPVWNKSNREHTIIGSSPASTRAAADEAVRRWAGRSRTTWTPTTSISRRWTSSSALAISILSTLPIRLAGLPKPPPVQAFVKRHPELMGKLVIPGIDHPLQHSTPIPSAGSRASTLRRSRKRAGFTATLRRRKGKGQFITEVSMDETDSPQTPAELLIILAAMADEGIPIQTIAPKFIGRFNKGVDYVGDVAKFSGNFRTMSPLSPLPSGNTACRQPETERTLRQRQVLDLRPDSPCS